VVVSRRRKVVGAGEGVWKIPEDTFLVGTVGGIMGSITAAIGIKCGIVFNSFINEINIYLLQLGYYLNYLIPGTFGYGYGVPPPLPLLFYSPSASLLGVYSFVLSVLLGATGVLVGFGFYGTYRIGGGAMGLSGLIFGVIGATSSALLIIMGNLTTGYDLSAELGFPGEIIVGVPIPTTPNFSLIGIGFAVLSFTFLVLGSASISVREVTGKPMVSLAAGILSILAGVFSILGPLGFISRGPITGIGIALSAVYIAFISFAPILVAFILWAIVFYYSRNL